MWRDGIAGLLGAALYACPASTADNPAADFTGMWARNAFNFEPITGQPAPLVNLKRIADGTGDRSRVGSLATDRQNAKCEHRERGQNMWVW